MVRFKNRYFAIEIKARDRPDHAPLELKKTMLYNTILRKVAQIHGDFGAASIANCLTAKYCNPYTKIAFIRCRHGPHRFVATVLPLISDLYNVPVQIRTIYVGATISKCFKYITKYQMRALERYWNNMKSDSDRQKMKKALMDLSTCK